MTELILTETDTSRLLDGLSRVACEPLGGDRSLILDVRYSEDAAVGISEWLNPASDAKSVLATYPLSAFRKSIAELARPSPNAAHRSAELRPKLPRARA